MPRAQQTASGGTAPPGQHHRKTCTRASFDACLNKCTLRNAIHAYTFFYGVVRKGGGPLGNSGAAFECQEPNKLPLGGPWARGPMMILLSSRWVAASKFGESWARGPVMCPLQKVFTKNLCWNNLYKEIRKTTKTNSKSLCSKPLQKLLQKQNKQKQKRRATFFSP